MAVARFAGDRKRIGLPWSRRREETRGHGATVYGGQARGRLSPSGPAADATCVSSFYVCFLLLKAYILLLLIVMVIIVSLLEGSWSSQYEKKTHSIDLFSFSIWLWDSKVPLFC